MEKEILKSLNEAFPQINFTESEEMVDDGILDSLTIVEMVSFLSMEYDIAIPYDEIIPENFNSITAIAGMVERLKK